LLEWPLRRDERFERPAIDRHDHAGDEQSSARTIPHGAVA
jgi:hypothetical protein